MPRTEVAFISEKMFKRVLKKSDFSSSIKKEYSKVLSPRMCTAVYMGSIDFNKTGTDTAHLIVIRKSMLPRTKRFLEKHYNQDFSLPETLLLPLIHETIHLYENVTGKFLLNHHDTKVTEAEKTIFMWFKTDHSEYFSKENERNITRTLSKIPDR